MAAIGKVLRDFGDKVVYRKALEVSDGDKAWAKDVREQTSASDEVCEAFGDVMDIVLKECGLDTKYLPLITAGTLVVGGVGTYAVCISDLNKKIRVKNAKQEIKP